MDGTLTIADVEGGVPAAVARVEAALDRLGVTVFARIDHAAAARAVGLELPDEVVLVFGDPAVGTALMQADPRVGIEPAPAPPDLGGRRTDAGGLPRSAGARRGLRVGVRRGGAREAPRPTRTAGARGRRERVTGHRRASPAGHAASEPRPRGPHLVGSDEVRLSRHPPGVTSVNVESGWSTSTM